jgi:hypothetical protein
VFKIKTLVDDVELPAALLSDKHLLLQFPKLQSLSLCPISNGFVEITQKNLFAMTALTRLVLPGEMIHEECCLSVSDYFKLAEAPFIGNLRELELVVYDFKDIEDDEELNEDLESSEPLPDIIEKAKNLRKFKLTAGDEGLEFFTDAPIGNIEKLDLTGCRLPNVFSLPCVLENLDLDCCCFASTDVLPALFNSGNLGRLKTLRMTQGYYNGSEVTVDWIDILRHVDLPAIESIFFDRCLGISESNIFYIADSAATIPNLKEYSVYLDSWNSRIGGAPLESTLVEKFCTSALGVKLESFELPEIIFFQDNGFPELVSSALYMTSLKSLKLKIVERPSVIAIAKAGERGGWPALQKMSLEIRIGDNDEEESEDWFSYCKNLFDPIWPGLKLRVDYGRYI